MTKDYNRLYSEVLHLTAAYKKSSRETGESSKATKELKEKLKEAKSQLDATAGSLKTAGQYMESFGESTGRTAGESLAGAFTKANLLSGALMKLGTAAVDAAKSFIQTGIDYNAQIEKYTTGLTNMLNSADAAQQAMANIQEDAARTPFNVDSLVSANQYLISAGENATYARKTIMALGDAVAATGGGSDELNRMAQNLQQIANTGKATAVDIKQFAYAGINVYGILADYTGKSTAEVQNMTVSYDLLTKALQAASEEGGRYYDAMGTQSQTMNGRVSTLQDNVKQLAGLMTGDLSDGIGVVIGNLNNLVVAAQEAYKTDGWIGLAGAITGLSGPIDSIKQKFSELGSAAVTALDKASYWLNKALGKNAYAGYSSYEDYRTDVQKQKNRDRLRQNAMNGTSVSNKSWSERQAEISAANGTGGSSITTSPSGTGSSSTGKKSSSSGSKTETVIASTSRTATSSIMTDLGAVTTSIETLNEKVKDSAGSIRDRVTQTTTTTGKEMVNGVATTYKQVQTVVDGVVTKTTKTYDDMSKSLLSTLTTTAKKVFDGITTTTQNAVETYADGSEHTKQTVTETGERIVDGVAQTYTKVITYVDGVKDKVTETAEAIDKSVKATEERIQGYVSNMSSASSTGFIWLLKNGFAQITGGDFAGLSQTFAKLLFGEVTQDQREIITKWLADVLGVLNEAYAGKGLAGVFDIAQKIFSGESIAAGVDGVTTSIKGLSEVLQGLAGSGEAGGILAKVGTGVAQMGGKLMGVLGTVVSFVAQNPIVLAIAAVAAGAVGLGIALWKKYKGSSDTDDTTQKSTGMSYKDIQDAYWYGNERAFAGYDYRTDPYTFNPNNSAVLGYQSRMQEYLAKLTDVVQQYLPDAANQQIVLQDGTLVGALAPGMDAQLGQLAVLAERGN